MGFITFINDIPEPMGWAIVGIIGLVVIVVCIYLITLLVKMVRG